MSLSHRAFAFVVIGALGMGVHLAVFTVLTQAAHLHYALASAMAVEMAVLHNFAWHERWTWSDRPAANGRERLARLVGFHLSNGMVSIVGTLLFTVAFVEGAGLPPLLASLSAVLATGVLNFVASDRLVFTGARRTAAWRHVRSLRWQDADAEGEPTA